MGRTDERAGFEAEVRIRLLEGDVDRHDSEFSELKMALKTQTQVLMGILVSVTTTCIVLLVTRVVG